MLRFQELSNESGIGRVTLVAPQFLLTESLDLARVDEVNGTDLVGVESSGCEAPIGSGLLKAGADQLTWCQGAEPLEKQVDAGVRVVEALGGGAVWAEEVAEQIGLSDIDAPRDGI